MKRRARSNSMFLRMLVRAAMLRKGSAVSALIAVTFAAAASTAMLNLFSDVQGKLRNEFRNFGANIVIEAPEGQTLTPDDIKRIRASVRNRGFAVPFGYAVARTAKDQAIVVAGTDFELARKLNPWWSVSRWPSESGQALVGVRAAKATADPGGNFILRFQGSEFLLSSVGTVVNGAGEESRVYVSLDDFERWTGLAPVVVEVSTYGTQETVNGVLRHLRQQFPNLDVRGVRQVAEAEANVVGKTRSTLLASAALIICTAGLCVLATLMGWVYDRRRDFAIMKALGASDRLIGSFVAGESAVLAFAGAVIGFGTGIGIAAWIGRSNFHAPVMPRLEFFPAVFAGCLVVTLLAAVLPLRLMRSIQPAMILRGE